jgi:molecular chaperone GrpE
MSENEKDENPPLVPDVSIKKSRPTRKVTKINWQTKDSFDDKDIPKEELQRSRGDQQKIDELNTLLGKQKKISERLLSDYQNLERRQQTEISEGVSKIKDDLLKNFIVIYEDFIRAKDAYEKEGANVDNLNGIIKNMKSILENYDVKPIPIEETETKSDPNLHTVEEEIEDNDHEAGTIVKEIAKGYIIRDKVLKYSKVCVSKKIIKE